MNKIDELELKEINRTIEILEAYKKGKTIEFYTSKYGWVKCVEAPFISIIRIYQYRIANKPENIETYEQ